MDIYERLVYSAFAVPDCLTAENQASAAGVALLKDAGIDLDDDRRRDLYQTAASAFVARLVEMCQSHSLDAVIGDFGWPDRPTAERDLLNSALQSFTRSTGPLPGGEAKSLTAAAIDRLVDYVRSHPDAIHKMGGDKRQETPT